MYICFSGGVGGAKLASGLSQLFAKQLTVVVNTGDDFEHMGLYICPDIDTVTYNLASMNNRKLGWGIEGETWNFMEATKAIGGPTWFRLGDRDLATHVFRTDRLRQGATLSTVTADITKALCIASRVVPMTDDRVHTRVLTKEGELPFQEYFVGRQCAPELTGLFFDGSAQARVSAGALSAIDDPELRAIFVGPSNPYLSVAPIMALPGLQKRLQTKKVPVIAVSPIVGGKAVKGPAAKIMKELGAEVSSLSVAKTYREWASAIVIDERDHAQEQAIRDLGLNVLVTDTMMSDQAAEKRLAREVADFARQLLVRR